MSLAVVQDHVGVPAATSHLGVPALDKYLHPMNPSLEFTLGRANIFPSPSLADIAEALEIVSTPGMLPSPACDLL